MKTVTEHKGSDFLLLKRVVYGKADTPLGDREYVIFGMANCPVGNRTEWSDFARTHGFVGLRIMELDGSMTLEFFDNGDGD